VKLFGANENPSLTYPSRRIFDYPSRRWQPLRYGHDMTNETDLQTVFIVGLIVVLSSLVAGQSQIATGVNSTAEFEKCEERGESCYAMINAVELCDSGSAFDDQYLCLCGAYHLYLPAVTSPYNFLMSPVYHVHECD